MSEAYAQIVALLSLGWGLRRAGILPPNGGEVLNLVVLYVCLPAAVLLRAPAVRPDGELALVALVPWVLFGVAAAIAARAPWSREVRGAWLMCVGLCNSSFVGFPLVRALLGERAVGYAVVYDQLGSFLALSTVGLWTIARAAGDATPRARDIAARIARFPALWALVLAVTVVPAPPPPWLARGLQPLADGILPLVMLAIGASIELRLPPEERAPLVAGLIVRLGVLPAVAWGLAVAGGLRGELLAVTVVESAMPSMVSAAALAMAAGLAPRLCAALVGWSLVAALVTVPLWAWVVR